MNKKQAGRNLEFAKEQGQKTYLGQPCRRGHPSGERYVSSRECLACTPVRAAGWAKRNPEAMSAAGGRWYAKNRDKKTAYTRDWNKKNPHFARKNNTNRRAKKLAATPKWLTAEQAAAIVTIYRSCPEGHEVDHIIPLVSKRVCGLHVPWNLQHLTIEANRRKSNKILQRYALANS